MARATSVHVCSECGHETARWAGRCPGCGEWNTLVEQLSAPPATSLGARRGRATAARPVALRDVRADDHRRLSTGIGELDNVLGGGIVPGSLVLIGGSPGIGKSTLTTMVLANMCAAGRRTLYVSAEESAAQIRLRAQRLATGEALAVPVIAETELDTVLATLEHERPEVCVIDSVQTLHSAELSSAAGSVAQVREVADGIMQVAKRLRIAVLLVGHVTKDGALAGPRVLEHLVDCVLQFEGERERTYRTVRAIKNRFGSTNDAGVFEMRDDGLVEVLDASARFVAEATRSPGSVVLCAMEGSRPLLVEVQALVTSSELVPPRRVVAGLDRNRVVARAGGARAPRRDRPRRRRRVRQRRRRRARRRARGRSRGRAGGRERRQAGGADRRRRPPAGVLRRARADRRAADGRARRSAAGRGAAVRARTGAGARDASVAAFGADGRARIALAGRRCRVARARGLRTDDLQPIAVAQPGGNITAKIALMPPRSGEELKEELESRQESRIMRALEMVAPGTSLREGIDNIVDARTGALIVIGDPEELAFLFSGGIKLDVDYSPAFLYELAKMDGAIVLSTNATKIAHVNVQLTPDPTILTLETGTRHRTAERVSKQTDAIVIAVSERREVVSLYVDGVKYILEDIPVVLAKANQALATLDKYRSRLDQVSTRLTALEFEGGVTLHDVLTVLQRAELVTRMAVEIERYIVELGTEGRLIEMQLDETMVGVAADKAALRARLPGRGHR